MSRAQLKRLKKLEAESQRLKRVVADLALDKTIFTEVAHLKRRAGRRPHPSRKTRVGEMANTKASFHCLRKSCLTAGFSCPSVKRRY